MQPKRAAAGLRPSVKTDLGLMSNNSIHIDDTSQHDISSAKIPRYPTVFVACVLNTAYQFFWAAFYPPILMGPKKH